MMGRWVILMLFVGTCTGCQVFPPFTDAVEADPPAPLTHAAQHVWSDCITNRIAVASEDPRRLPAPDLAPGIISACSTERNKVIELAKAEHKSLLSFDAPPAVAAWLQMARARKAGINSIELPGYPGAVEHISRAELDRRLQRWDDCTDGCRAILRNR